ncbi:MAG: hypothetical protein MI867_03885 [Pseudomonadales bacterium]|nr:hypothetical protein [Pseudomonadales bacterium]
MNLNQTAAQLRPRNPYEAMDLGTSMVRQWWKELWLIWFVVSLPFALIIWFGLFVIRDWSVLLLWWCKPLWETPLLHFVAEKLFQGDITAKDILKRTPKLLIHDLILKITLRRVSISRAFDMPVSELERLSGTTRNKRLNVLHRTSSSAAIWLTIAGSLMESVIFFACFSLIALFIPEHIAFDLDVFDFLLDEDWELWRFIFAYIAMSMIGPFYIAAGFCLYINRRTILEGWDIELTFKQLMSRISAPIKSIAIVLMLGLSSLALVPHPAYAEEDPDTWETSPKHSREAIINILESDTFNRIEIEDVLLPKDRDLEEEDSETPEFLKWLSKLFGSIAQGIEVLLWIAAIALVIFILFKLNEYRLKQGKGVRKVSPVKTPDTLFGLDIREDSLPNDIIGAARELWRAQHFREAYSLLYRGALIYIAHVKSIPLHESFTEEECVDQFQQMDDGLEPFFFAQLTQQWQMVAYGHQVPGTSIFETTCDGWEFHFRPPESELNRSGGGDE